MAWQKYQALPSQAQTPGRKYCVPPLCTVALPQGHDEHRKNKTEHNVLVSNHTETANVADRTPEDPVEHHHRQPVFGHGWDEQTMQPPPAQRATVGLGLKPRPQVADQPNIEGAEALITFVHRITWQAQQAVQTPQDELLMEQNHGL